MEKYVQLKSQPRPQVQGLRSGGSVRVGVVGRDVGGVVVVVY